MRGPPRIDLASVRHPRERTVLLLSVIANVGVIALAVAIVYFAPEWVSAHGRLERVIERIRLTAVAAILVLPVLWVLRVGRWAAFRENSVRLGRNQVPEIHAILERHCRALGMEPPELYASSLVKAGTSSALTRSRGRQVIVLGPEVFTGLGAIRDRTDVFSFVLGQELGRLALGHATWWEDLVLGYLKRIPLLRYPLLAVQSASRDRFAATLAPEGVRGLVLVAVGGDLLDHVDLEALLRQVLENDTPWIWKSIASRERDEANFAKRLRDLHRAGLLRVGPSVGPASGPSAPRARWGLDDAEEGSRPPTH